MGFVQGWPHPALLPAPLHEDLCCWVSSGWRQGRAAPRSTPSIHPREEGDEEGCLLPSERAPVLEQRGCAGAGAWGCTALSCAHSKSSVLRVCSREGAFRGRRWVQVLSPRVGSSPVQRAPPCPASLG